MGLPLPVFVAGGWAFVGLPLPIPGGGGCTPLLAQPLPVTGARSLAFMTLPVPVFPAGGWAFEDGTRVSINPRAVPGMGSPRWFETAFGWEAAPQGTKKNKEINKKYYWRPK